jgi:hypothetical protein
MEILIRRNNRYLIVIIRNLHILKKKNLEKKKNYGMDLRGRWIWGLPN